MVTIFHSRHSLGYCGFEVQNLSYFDQSGKRERERERERQFTSSQAIVTPSLAQPRHRHTQRKHESKELSVLENILD